MTMTMKDSIICHLRRGKRVWLTGHSKGGAIATTAAARLICGQTSGMFEKQPCHLSIVTFNSPKAFKGQFAEVYEDALRRFRLEHLRVEHKADVVRHLPLKGLRHVGTKMEVGQSFFDRCAETTTAAGNESSQLIRYSRGAVRGSRGVLNAGIATASAHKLDKIDLR